MKIATILPYKENYTFATQAAAIWVSDFYKIRNLDQNFIFGNTNTKDFSQKIMWILKLII